jgi:hypothetical protein
MASKASDRLMARFSPGDVVYREGEPGDEMFVVQKGKIRLTRNTGGESSELSVLGKGDFFGEMSLLEGLARAETAEVVEPAECLRVNGLVFNKMITTNAEIAVRMLRKISKRLTEANDKVTALVAESRQARSGEVQVPREPRTTVVAPEAAAPPMPRATLVVAKSNTTYLITRPLTLIGRHDPVTGIHPEIDLSKEELGKSVSRRHAKIEYRDGQFFLTEEIGTLNNTTVNGVKLETGVMTPLLDGDELCLGAVKLRFRVGAG